MIAAVVALALATIAIKAAGTLLPAPPAWLARRLASLAPALLAALVVTELGPGRAWPRPDEKAAGVVVAIVLATLRAPFAVAVVAGAATAAALRLL